MYTTVQRGDYFDQFVRLGPAGEMSQDFVVEAAGHHVRERMIEPWARFLLIHGTKHQTYAAAEAAGNFEGIARRCESDRAVLFCCDCDLRCGTEYCWFGLHVKCSEIGGHSLSMLGR
ncbi:hypothetical protein D3C77_684630 [compost metagenome]